MSKGESSSNSQDPELAFITYSDQRASKDPRQQQLARTHAIKNSLQRKRQQLQSTNSNFVDETQNIARRGRRRSPADNVTDSGESGQTVSLARSIVDPFGTFAIDIDRLKALAQQQLEAGDIMLDENGPIEFQNLRSVFASGVDDPSISSAFCLALALAANEGVMSQECDMYRLKAIQHINQRLANPTQAASDITIGAVLLLAGVEGRLGEREVAQMHLNGIYQLLQLSNQQNISLHPIVGRAMFWQDMFLSIIAGTGRVFSYEMFPELHWQRDVSQPDLYSIPDGLKVRTHILGNQLTEIIGEICGLQRLCERSSIRALTDREATAIDNQQASIEARLITLRYNSTESLGRCCIAAAFLCAYGLFTEIWGSHQVLSHLTSYLLQELRAVERWPGWDEHADLLLWLINMGLSFAIDFSTEAGFLSIWRGSQVLLSLPDLRSWQGTEQRLKQFVWSDRFPRPNCETIWEDLQ